METLRVVIGTSGTALNADTALGIAKGYFQAHQLTVKLTDGANANVPNLIVSGQDDVAFFAPTSALQIAAKGQPTTVIRGLLGAGVSSDLAASPGIGSIAALRAKPDCKVATFTKGSNVYGDTVTMLKTLNLGNCSLLTFSSASAEAGAVVSGNADAGVQAGSAWQSAISAGKVHLLLDTSKAADRALLGKSLTFTEAAYFGLTSTIKANGSAVVKFIAGLNDAIAFMKSQTPDAVAAVLKTYPSYAAESNAVIAAGVAGSRDYFDLNTGPGGVITEANWNALLQAMTSWDIPGYAASDPGNSYSSRVDMTYAKEALRL